MANMRDVKAALARGEDIRNIPVVPSAPDPSLVQCEWQVHALHEHVYVLSGNGISTVIARGGAFDAFVVVMVSGVPAQQYWLAGWLAGR
jgi:hypothetical protein